MKPAGRILALGTWTALFVHHEMAWNSFAAIDSPTLGGMSRQKRLFWRMYVLLFVAASGEGAAGAGSVGAGSAGAGAVGAGAVDATEARAKTKVKKRAIALKSMLRVSEKEVFGGTVAAWRIGRLDEAAGGGQMKARIGSLLYLRCRQPRTRARQAIYSCRPKVYERRWRRERARTVFRSRLYRIHYAAEAVPFLQLRQKSRAGERQDDRKGKGDACPCPKIELFGPWPWSTSTLWQGFVGKLFLGKWWINNGRQSRLSCSAKREVLHGRRHNLPHQRARCFLLSVLGVTFESTLTLSRPNWTNGLMGLKDRATVAL